MVDNCSCASVRRLPGKQVLFGGSQSPQSQVRGLKRGGIIRSFLSIHEPHGNYTSAVGKVKPARQTVNDVEYFQADKQRTKSEKYKFVDVFKGTPKGVPLKTPKV